MKDFESYDNYLNEELAEEPKYGCVMLFADVPDWKKLIKRLVREEDLYKPDDDDYGFDNNPHITLLYGIHHDSIVDLSIIYRKIEDISVMKFTVKEINIFESDDYDVVKFDITPTKKLLSLREEFEEDIPNTQTFSDYHPHVTIAYVKKGMGNKYKRIFKKGIKFNFVKGVYSSPEYKKVYIDLKNTKEKYKK
jgi:2'-5' RNA ligase